MATTIEMPKLSDTMEEGGIANWLKKEGDSVEEGEPLVEIETDKATMEYASPESGVLLKILVPAGKGAALNAPIAIIGAAGEKVEAGGASEGKDKGEAPKKAAEKTAAPAAKAESSKSAAPAPAQLASGNPSSTGEKLRSSPLARKLANDRGIDLTKVQGSGPAGRVIAKDLDTSQAAGGSAAAKSSSARSTSAASSRQDERIPHTMMRKTIAKRLTQAKNIAPHFYLTRSIAMTQALAWRERVNAKLAPSGGKVSVNDLIVLAAAKALRRHPEVNASFEEEGILRWGSVHVAVAVALPQGLVTPVIRNTDEMGLAAIGAESKRLIQAAKDGKLGNDDYLGGTFTISNLGMLGIEEFTAIINPPQSAILAVGATVPTPHVDAKGQIVVQERMKVTLSCDHRAIDGATGAYFLQTLAEFLEDPGMMLS